MTVVFIYPEEEVPLPRQQKPTTPINSPTRDKRLLATAGLLVAWLIFLLVMATRY